MKYIRTKNGNIGECWRDNEKETWVVFKRPHQFRQELKRENILKQADTIEELCDEFVVIVDGKHYIRVPASNPNFQTYGAIWTDKGLIYIAKMNDKGELELL